MLIAAAVCPHPPLLVPEVAQGAAPELDALRGVCDQAVAALGRAEPDALLVVGAGESTTLHGPSAAGTLRAFGVDITVGGAADGAVLPLSLTLGAWLLARSGLRATGYAEVARDASPRECRDFGARLAGSAPRTAMLAMGDGSARRTEHSPGAIDERAAGFDADVAEALGQADTPALAGLDPALAIELMAAGRPAWQVLAGAAEGAGLAGELLTHQAPYGVGYFVARWGR